LAASSSFDFGRAISLTTVAAFIGAKFPSGFLEPLGLAFVRYLRASSLLFAGLFP
jgi:hypothetical protein